MRAQGQRRLIERENAADERNEAKSTKRGVVVLLYLSSIHEFMKVSIFAREEGLAETRRHSVGGKLRVYFRRVRRSH